MYQETTLHDFNNLSHIRRNYVKEMVEAAWISLWFWQGFQYFSNPESKEIPRNICSNLPMELEQYMQFTHLIYTQFCLLETAVPETPNQFLNENHGKNRQLLAAAPSTTATRVIRLQGKKIFHQLYHCYTLFTLASQPELILKRLPGLIKKPWADEESKQLFQLMEAGCHLKMSHPDKALELMKKARDTALWTENAKDADASIRTITGNLPALRELWKKKQAGNEEAAKAYKKGTTIMASPVFFTF